MTIVSFQQAFPHIFEQRTAFKYHIFHLLTMQNGRENGNPTITKALPAQRDSIASVRRDDVPKFASTEREELATRYATLVKTHLDNKSVEFAGHTNDGTELRQAQEVRVKNQLT